MVRPQCEPLLQEVWPVVVGEVDNCSLCVTQYLRKGLPYDTICSLPSSTICNYTASIPVSLASVLRIYSVQHWPFSVLRTEFAWHCLNVAETLVEKFNQVW